MKIGTHSKNFIKIALILTQCVGLTACVTTQLPKISHVHIGHAMTAWKGTPEEQGLFITAENEAKRALNLINESSKDITNLKNQVKKVQQILDPKLIKDQTISSYGFIKAISSARDHVLFAAESKDASENIKTSSKRWSKDIDAVIERSQLIIALNNDILSLNDFEEAKILLSEAQSLIKQNLYGADSDNNGVIGNVSNEVGIKQLENQMEVMISKEKPPYQVIDKKYLFGLIRLPSGVWEFFFGDKEVYDSGY